MTHNFTIKKNGKDGKPCLSWLFAMLFIITMGFSNQSSGQIAVVVTNATNTTPNLATNYPSLANALADLNLVNAMSGPVTLTLTGGGSETAPPSGFTIGSANLNPVLSSTNTVTINTSGSPVTLNAGVGIATPTSSAPDGIIKITGADWITLDGISLNDGNTGNPGSMEYGIGLFKLSATDGAQNITIKNCIINMQRVNNASSTAPMVEGSVGILVINSTVTAATTSLSPATASGANSNNKFYSNIISGGNYGIALSGFAATSPFTTGDTNNDIGGSSAGTGNTILNYGGGGSTNPAAGIRANNQWGINISYNTINNNNGSGVNHATTLRGIYAQAGTSANATINNNFVTVISGASTSALTGIENAIGSTPASNTVNINNNSVQNCSYPTATSGAFNAILSSANPAALNMNGNIVNNNTLPGTGIFTGIYSSGTATNLSINNNQVTNNQKTGASGSFYSLRLGTSIGIISGNSINNNSMPNTSGTTSSSLYGIYSFASPTGETFTNNTITNLSIGGTATSTSHLINAIYTNSVAGSVKDLSGNIIHTLSFNGTSGSCAVVGISTTTGNTVNIAKNRIGNISSDGTASTATGILVASGVTVTLSNNIIGDLRTSSANAANPLTGISITGGTTVNAYYNTINLNLQANSGALFGSSAISVSTSPTVTLRNNIFVNTSKVNGAGLTVAYRRSSTTLTTYGSASNNNLFYTGDSTITANKIFYDGTNADQGIFAYKTRVSTRDNSSITENPTWVNTTASSPAFLHINTANSTQIESGAVNIAGITDDYDGNIRQGNAGYTGSGTAPDIGGDEFNGTTPSPIINSVSASPSANQCVAVSRAITANVTAGLSPITSVILSYAYNGGTPVQVAMSGGTSTGTSNWTGTIPAATPVNATVTWSVSITDGTYTQTASGASYKDAYLNNAVTTASANPAAMCAGTSTTLSVSSLDGAPGTTTIGTQSTTSISGSPYRAGAGSTVGNKAQYLFTAAELQAAGLAAGNITAIAFNIPSGTTFNPIPNFQIKLGTTSVSNLTATFEPSPSQTVLGPVTYTPNLGVNTHTFTTLFNWNGSSNILIEVCNPPMAVGTSLNVAMAAVTGIKQIYQNDAASCSGTSALTTANRPVLSFSGIIGVNYTPTLTWTWQPGSLSGNPVTVTPSSTTIYTATGTDANGCTVTSNGVTVTVNPLPPAPTSNNSTQCGTQVPTASVTGIGNSFKWYLAPAGGSPLAGETGSQLVNYSVSSSTTFYVSQTSNGCEGPRVAVNVTVTSPDPVTAIVSPDSVCANGMINLTATNSGGNNTYTYSWSTVPSGGTATGGNTTATVAGTGGNQIWIVTATDASAGCITSAQDTVFVISPPLILNISAMPDSVCPGSNTTLTAVTPVVTSGTIKIGTGTTGFTGASNPYYRNDEGFKAQFLVKASALTALGLYPGNLTAIGFTMTSVAVSPNNLNGYTIKLAHTTLANLTSFVSSGFSTVYGPVNYSPVNGLNTHAFSSPFAWDGTSNIIVQVCYDNDPNNVCSSGSPICYGNNPAVEYTSSVGYTATRYYTADNTSIAARNMCDTLPTGTTQTNLPNISFTGQINNGGPGTLSWIWNPGSLTGNSVVVNPTIQTTYTVTATDPASGCSSTATKTIYIKPTPAAPLAVVANATQCGTQVPGVQLSRSGNASDSFKWYTVATGGTAIANQADSVYTATISTTTTFYVAEYNGICESERTVLIVTVTQPDSVSISTSAAALCLGQTASLAAVKTGTSNNYSYTWSVSPSANSGLSGTSGNTIDITPTAAGSYLITLTATDASAGCNTVANITLPVYIYPAITNVSSSSSTICAGDSVQLSAQSIPAIAGTTTVGAGATTSATYSNPFYSLWSNAHNQHLIPASELIAAGLTTGNITSLGVTITAAGTLPMIDFSLKVGTTTATNMSSFVSSSLSTVYTASSLMPVTGLNTMTFTTPFYWDGVSNLLIELCHGNPSSTATMSRTAQMDVTPYVSTIHTHVTTSPGTGGSVICSNTSSNVLTYSLRPKFTFGGQVGSNLTSNYSWIWNPGNISGNVATVYPLTNTSYTVTATNGGICSTTSSPVAITVNQIPAAPSATNSTQCGVGIPTASVTGSGNTFNWYLAATGGSPLAGENGNTLTSYSINSSTAFYVSEVNGLCEGPRDAVQADVTVPDSVHASVDMSSVCPGNSIQLSVTKDAGSNNYFYTWDANPAAGSGMLTSMSGTSVNVTPTASGTYTYTVTAVDAGASCTITSSISVTVNPSPVLQTSHSPLATCAGQNVTLTATTPVIAAGTATVGTGTVQNAISTTTNMPPYGNYYTGNRHQMLIKASALTASGMQAGNITSLAFDVVSNSNALGYNNFTILLKHTNANALTTTFETGATQVYTIGNFNPVQGWSTHIFQTPFAWNGTSNIIVETYFSNCTNCTGGTTCGTTGSGITYTENAVTNQTTTNYVSHAYYYSDAAGCNPQTVATASTSNSVLPNMRLGAENTATYGAGSLSWIWNPGNLSGNTVTVNPNTSTVYTVTGTDSVTGCSTTVNDTVVVMPTTVAVTRSLANPICNGNTVTLTATPSGSGAPFTYSWNNGTGIVGTSSTLTVTPSATTIYTVSITNSCNQVITTSDTVEVNNPQVTSTTPGERCGAGTVTLSASSAAGNTLNWYSTAAGGSILGTGSSFSTPVINDTTTYYVSASNGGSTVVTGRLTPQAGVGTNLSTYGQDFTITQPLVLNSVKVISTTGTSITVSLYNSTGATQLHTTGALTVPTNDTTIVSLGWNLAPGTYRLAANSMTGNFIRENSTVTYPISLSNVGQINGFVSSITGSVTTSSSYYWFYSWSITTGCEGTRMPVVATVNPAPALAATASPASICAGSSSTLSVTTGSGDFDVFTWSPATGLNTTSGASVIATINTSQSYTLTAENSISGCINTAVVNVTATPSPAVSIAPAGPVMLCSSTGNSVTLTATGVSTYSSGYRVDPITYNRVPCDTNSGPTADDQVTSSLNIGFAFNYFGINYTQFAISSNGNIQLGDGSGIAGNPLYSSDYNAAAIPTAAVPNNMIALAWKDLNPSSGGTIKWGVNGNTGNKILTVCFNNVARVGGGIFNGQIQLHEGSNTIDLLIDTMTSGTNIVQGIENATGTNGLASPGRNKTTWSVSTAAPSAYRFTPERFGYSWSPATGLNTTSGAVVTATPPVGSTMNYIVTYMDSLTGCSGSDTVTVTSTATPSPKVYPGDSLLCSGQSFYQHVIDTGAYAAGYPAGTTVDWVGIALGLSPADSVNTSGITDFQVIVKLPAAIGGCTATSPNAHISTHQLDVVPAIINTTCGASNGKIVVNVMGTSPYRYTWSDGSGVIRDVQTAGAADSITGLSSGFYYLTVIDNDGNVNPGISCNTGQLSYFVPSNGGPVASISSYTDLTCAGSANGTATAAQTGGMGTITYSWSPYGGTDATADSLSAGTFTVVVTDGNGCAGAATVTITEPDTLFITGSSIDASCGTADGVGVGIVQGGRAPYSFTWYDENFVDLMTDNDTLTGLAAGTYYVAVYDSAFNCNAFDTVFVSQNCNPSPAILNLTAFIEGFDLGGAMQPVLFNSASAIGASYPNTTDCDTITVELHDQNSTSVIVASAHAVLQVDGTAMVSYPDTIAGGTYYIVVRNRTMVETWSASPVTFGPVTPYNFTTAASQAYGNNLKESSFAPGIWVMYSGDIDDGSITATQDGSIDAFDFLIMDIDIQAGVGGYYVTDLDGSGNTDAFDFLVLDPNIQAGISKLTPP